MQDEEKNHLPVHITVIDMIRALISISFAGCCWLLKHCIRLDSQGILRAHPLPDNGQGMVLRAHATPMPCQTADIASIIFMNACLGYTSHITEEHNEYVSDTLQEWSSSVNEDSVPLDRYCRIHNYR